MRPSSYAQAVRAFWNLVAHKELPDACWTFQGARDALGYGIVQWSIRRFLKQRTAHRTAYVLTYGAVSGALGVLHRCDNPPCCNPSHLFAGTPLDNSNDKIAKGRYRAGVPPASVRKLTVVQAQVVESLLRHGVSQRKIGRIVGLTCQGIAGYRKRYQRRVTLDTPARR